jgi:hypothetical protein
MQDFIADRKIIIKIVRVFFALCIIGISILYYIYNNPNMGNESFDRKKIIIYFLAIAVSYNIFYILNLCIHELGHLLFGLICGYKLLSIRIFKYLIVMKNKYKIYKIGRFNSIGQCSMIKKDEERLSCTLYNIGGCLLNLFTVAVILVLIHNNIIIDHLIFYYVFCIVGLNIFIINAVPSTNKGVFSDGLNTYLFFKNKDMRKTNYYQLLIYGQLLNNCSPRNIALNEQDILYIKNNINAYSYYPLYNLYLKFMEEENFMSAKEILSLIKANEKIFSKENRAQIWLEYIYFNCLANGQDIEVSSEDINKVEKLSSSGAIEIIRVYHALCKTLLKDEERARKYEVAVREVLPIYMNGLFDFHRNFISKFDYYHNILHRTN